MKCFAKSAFPPQLHDRRLVFLFRTFIFTTHHTLTLHFDQRKLLSILRRYYGVTCPPWLNTAHIPQHTYIEAGDETYINLDYTKI